MMTNTSDDRGTAGLLILILLAMLAAAGPSAAGPQVTTAYGDQLTWYGAEINAMGGTGTALYRGGLSNVFNPAFLIVEQGKRVDAGLSLDQEHEDRFQPLFDSFQSWVADAAIASNRHHYWQTGFALAGRVELSRPVVVALSLTDRYPYGYRFEEELRSPSPFTSDPVPRDQIIALREREVTGTLRALSLGAATDVASRVSLGAAVHYNFGTRAEINTSRDTDELGTDDSFRNEDDFDLNGVNFTVGLRGRINERVVAGLAWESQLTADGDWTALVSDSADPQGTSTTHEGYYRYPNVFRAGLTFYPRTDPRTVFSLEVEFKPWSEMADSENPGYDNPQHLQDVADVRVGLEHTFYNGMPLRFGFRHVDSYADRDAGAAVFTAGTGMLLGRGRLNASLELTKLTSVQPHQFPYPTDYFGRAFVSDPEARVEDTRFRVGVGYTMEF